MKQLSPQIPAVGTRFSADPEDSRRETLGDDHIELVESVGRHGRTDRFSGPIVIVTGWAAV